MLLLYIVVSSLINQYIINPCVDDGGQNGFVCHVCIVSNQPGIVKSPEMASLFLILAHSDCRRKKSHNAVVLGVDINSVVYCGASSVAV